MKNSSPTSALKKVVVTLSDHINLQGYLNPADLPGADPLPLLTPEGESRLLALRSIRAIYFVREFTDRFEHGRKAFLSRPKLQGLWVRLRFQDDETWEGVIPNDLLSLVDSGVHITPPDLNGAALRIFVPRAALGELTVLGVVGMTRRKPAAPSPAQPRLFVE